jgi:sugar phosphate isomerase/epimerase
MLHLGYNTNGFAHHRLADALAILADLGYAAVALTPDCHHLDPFADDFARQLAAVRPLLARFPRPGAVETGARFLLDPLRKHQPTLLDPFADGRARRLDFLERCVRLAAGLGWDVVSFWSGAAPASEADDVLMARLADGCLRLCDAASSAGVRLAFEPEPGMFVDTMERFADLHARVGRPNFGLTLDVGHLQCQGELPIGGVIRHWRQWLWNVHIEDMRLGVHDHLMFGEGEIDFADVLGALQAIGYAGGVHVELSRHSHDAVSTARRSLAFLRGRLPSQPDAADVLG